ncbi:MAG: hypothetical protein JXA28_13195, partial [Bacteroidetes bacterium]|nr:hypothetical protein [Bacteroidota bacterium]
KAQRTMRKKDDIAHARKELVEANAELVALEDRFRDDVREIKTIDPLELEISSYALSPRKSDITVTRIAVAWLPER